MKIIEKSQTIMFFRQRDMTNNKKNGRDAGHRSPEWGCISDPKILKFKGGKPSGGRETKKSLTVRIYCYADSDIVMVDLGFGDDFFEQDRSWDDFGTTISGI